MIGEFIRMNYVVFVTMGFLLIFLCTSTNFEKRLTILFQISAVAIILANFANSVNYCAEYLNLPVVTRNIMLCISNIGTPLSILMVILVICDKLNYWYKAILTVPMAVEIIVIIIFLLARFASDSNGRMSATTFRFSDWGRYITLFYAVIIFSYAILCLIVDKSYRETIMLGSLSTVIGIVAFVSTPFKIVELQCSINAICIVFFYLYYHTQNFRKDSLTGVFNRRTFDVDSQRMFDTLTAIISIDLNNLKKLNDEKGHSEGDRAICTMVNTVRRSKLSGCYLYRTGGDEFQMLCTKHSIIEIYNMVEEIKTNMAKTPYTWAMGVVDVKWGTNIEELLEKADEAMYADKKAVKLMMYTKKEFDK